MRVKITVEDSSERWITLEETEARELQLILNNIFTAPTSIIVPKGTLVKESPDGSAKTLKPWDLIGCAKKNGDQTRCYCNDCYSEEFRSHI